MESFFKVNHIGTARTKPSFVYAIIGVALVLFLLGFFGLLVIQGRQLVTHFKENLLVLVELKQERDVVHFDSLTNVLRNAAFVKQGSLSFTTKEDALELLKTDFGDEFTKMSFSNPLYDMLSFNVRATYVTPDSLAYITNLLKQDSIVSDVFYREQLVNDIGLGVGRLGWFGLLLSLCLVFVAATLIHNTVKLTIYSNRFLIKNMQLVGASWSFISRPYITQSIKHGLVSALIAIVALFVVWWVALRQIPELKIIQNPLLLLILSLILVVLGIGISFYSTRQTVRRYLRARIDDLY